MIAALLFAAALAQTAPPATPDIPLEDSAWRVSTPWSPSSSGYRLNVLADRTACSARGRADVDACLPWVDAPAGQLHVSLEVTDGDAPVAFALSNERLVVGIGGTEGFMPVPREDIAVVPHDPAGYRQLYVILIDRSASMYDPRGEHPPAMADVVGTLRSEAVRKTFFPEGADVRTGVLLLTFSDHVAGVAGQPWKDAEILEDDKDYDAALDQLLYVPPAAYTDLYGAVETVVDGVLLDPDVAAFVDLTHAYPAVVVLTDGFHDPRAAQTCGDNAAPLTALLDRVRRSRTAIGRPAPVVHAVGFGQPYRPEFHVPALGTERITPELLCGADAGQRIDGALEKRGIDNASLSMLADAGGGRTYVGEDVRDLATFLAGSVTRLHKWFEVYIRLDAERHQEFRQRFRAPMPLLLQASGPQRVESRLTFYPHPWIDEPRAALAPGAPWSSRGRVGAVLGWVVLAIGAHLLIVALGVAWRHGARAIGRRGLEAPEPPSPG